jgi:hypothetical protein
MASRESKIMDLENKLQNEKMISNDGSNCLTVAQIDFKLARLYMANGDIDKYQAAIDDAKSELTAPGCPQTRQRDYYLNAIGASQGSQEQSVQSTGIGTQQAQRMPRWYGFIGLIFLLIGYAILFGMSYFVALPAYEFEIGIFVIFIASMFVSSYVRSMYRRRH